MKRGDPQRHDPRGDVARPPRVVGPARGDGGLRSRRPIRPHDRCEHQGQGNAKSASPAGKASRRRAVLVGSLWPCLALAVLLLLPSAHAANDTLAAQRAEAEKEFTEAHSDWNQKLDDRAVARQKEKALKEKADLAKRRSDGADRALDRADREHEANPTDATAKKRDEAASQARDRRRERGQAERDYQRARAEREEAEGNVEKARERLERANDQLGEVEDREKAAKDGAPGGDSVPATPPTASPSAASPPGTVALDPRTVPPAGGGMAQVGGVTMHTLPTGDVILARGPDQVQIPAGTFRGVSDAQNAVDAALKDPGAVKNLQAFVDAAFQAGNDAALTAVVFDLQAQPPGSALAGVRDDAETKLQTLATQGSPATQATLAAIDGRVEILKSQDVGSLVGTRLRDSAGILVQSGWQGVAIFDYYVTLSHVTQLHTLAYSTRSAQEQEALAAQLVTRFDETRTLTRLLSQAVVTGGDYIFEAVRFGDTVYLTPVQGGNVVVVYVVPPGQVRQPGEISSTDATGQLLIGRFRGDVVELGGQNFRVNVVRSTLTPSQAQAIAQNRLAAVQGEIQSLLTIPGEQAPMTAEECARLEAALPQRSTVIRQRDATLADKERRLAEAERELDEAVNRRDMAEAGLLMADGTEQRVKDAQARLDQARAERDQARRERDAAFTDHAILGVEVDGKPLYVHLATRPAGDTGWNLIDKARFRQIELAKQGLAWWGTDATLSEKVAFAGVMQGSQQQILADPGLQAAFGPAGLRLRIDIVVGAGEAAELTKAQGRLEGDVFLTIAAIPGALFPPIGVILAVAGGGKAVQEYRQDAATAAQMEQLAQSGLSTREAIGDRNRPPSVGFLIAQVVLEGIGGFGDFFATLSKGGKATGAAARSADAAAGGSDVAAAGGAKVAAGGDASRSAGTADAAKTATTGTAGATPPSPGTSAAPPGSGTTPATPTGSGASPRGPPDSGTPQTGTSAVDASEAPTVNIPPSDAAVSQTARTEILPEGRGVRVDKNAPTELAQNGLSEAPTKLPSGGAGAQGGALAPGNQLSVPGPPGTSPAVVQLETPFGAGGQATVFKGTVVAASPQSAAPVTVRFPDGTIMSVPVSPWPGQGRIVAVKAFGRSEDPWRAFRAELEGQVALHGDGIRTPDLYAVGVDAAGKPYMVREAIGTHELAGEFANGRTAPPPPGTAVTFFLDEGVKLTPAQQTAKTEAFNALAAQGKAVPDARFSNELWEIETLPDGRVVVRWGMADTQFVGPIGDPLVQTQFELLTLGMYRRPPGFTLLGQLDQDARFRVLDDTAQGGSLVGDARFANAMTLERFPEVVFDEATGLFKDGRMRVDQLRRESADFVAYEKEVRQAWLRRRGAGATTASSVGTAPSSSSAAGATPPSVPGGAGSALGTGAGVQPASRPPGVADASQGTAIDTARGAAKVGQAAARTEQPSGQFRVTAGALNVRTGPGQSRVSLAPGPNGRPQFVVRFGSAPWWILEFPQGLQEPQRTTILQSLPSLMPGARQVNVPEGAGGASPVFTFPASHFAVKVLEAWLRGLGVPYQLEDEALLAIQGPRHGEARPATVDPR